MKIRAFAPASISCLFEIVDHKDPRWMGSRGVGFTLKEGVTVEVTSAKKTETFFNKKRVRISAVSDVVTSLTTNPVKVSISSLLPIGYGFGISGACALATALAVNKLYRLQKSAKELAVIAHTADAKNKTGLGDVENQYKGGFFVRYEPSSYFSANRIPIKNISVYCKWFSPKSTHNILSDKAKKLSINKAASDALKQVKALSFKKNPVELFSEIINISERFTYESSLLTDRRVKRTIETIKSQGGNASMIMVGNGVFSNIPFEESTPFLIGNKKASVL